MPSLGIALKSKFTVEIRVSKPHMQGIFQSQLRNPRIENHIADKAKR